MEEIEKEFVEEEKIKEEIIINVTEEKKDKYPGIGGALLLLLSIFIINMVISFVLAFWYGIYLGIGDILNGNTGKVIKAGMKEGFNLKWMLPVTLISTYTLAIYYILKIKNRIKFKKFYLSGTIIKDFRIIFIGTFFILLAMFLSVLFGFVMEKFGIKELEEGKMIADTIKGPIGIFMGLGIAPFFEESIFRGIILRGSAEKYGEAKGVFISAALFSLFHMTFVQLFPTFVFGLIVGYVYVKTKSLLVAMMCHFFYNFIPVVAAQFITESSVKSVPQEKMPFWIVLFFGIPLLLNGLLIFKAGFGEKSKIAW